MNRKTSMSSMLLLAALAAAQGCDGASDFLRDLDASDRTAGQVIFRTSFETAADTAGWQRFGTLALRPEAPPGGGRRSAFVEGGCIAPHAARGLTVSRSGTLRLHAWARNLDIGGVVGVTNTRTGESIHIGVNEKEWTRYASDRTLAVRSGDRLQIEMSAGGIVASSMLVDLLEVVHAD